MTFPGWEATRRWGEDRFGRENRRRGLANRRHRASRRIHAKQMNLPRVGDELERGGRVRAHYRDPNDASVSALFHRDPRFARTRATGHSLRAGGLPRHAGPVSCMRTPREASERSIMSSLLDSRTLSHLSATVVTDPGFRFDQAEHESSSRRDSARAATNEKLVELAPGVPRRSAPWDCANAGACASRSPRGACAYAQPGVGRTARRFCVSIVGAICN